MHAVAQRAAPPATRPTCTPRHARCLARCAPRDRSSMEPAGHDEQGGGGDPSSSSDSSSMKARAAAAVRPAHASGGPTGGLIAKSSELLQRFRETPGATLQERFDAFYAARVSEMAADATGVTWPAERVTRLWKFFFKANAGTTDRYGFAISMGPLDQRSDAERAAARDRAAAALVNIDPSERQRRLTLGLGLVAVMVAAAAALLAQDDSFGGTLGRPLLKVGLLLPAAFGTLLAASGAGGPLNDWLGQHLGRGRHRHAAGARCGPRCGPAQEGCLHFCLGRHARGGCGRGVDGAGALEAAASRAPLK